MTKSEIYQNLLTEIATSWTAAWGVQAEPDWEEFRAIDEWLLATRDHPDVSIEAYQEQAERLRKLYMPGEHGA